LSGSFCSDHSDARVVACTLFAALIPLAPGGVALMNAGFTRARGVMHVLFASLFASVIAALAFLSIGFIWQASPCLANHSVYYAGRYWNVLGSGPFFLRGIASGDVADLLFVLLGAFSVAMAAVIPIGAASERWRLGPALLAAAIQAAFVFPVYSHWVWPGGWLAELGFVDTGGSGFIHAVGGLWALTVAWFVGPRRGKYTASGMPTATPGHNAPYLIAGSFLAWVGWCGINGAGAMLLGQQDLSHLPYVLLNTLAGAMGGVISAAFLTRTRFGKTDASLCVNGWLGGLVAGSAGCALLPPPMEVLAGLIAGTLIVFSVEVLEMRLKIDDPCGAISVHGVCGLWGVLAVGLFQGVAQTEAQLSGIAMILGVIFPLTYGINFLVNRFLPYRVAREGERQGMDLFELGAGAYPEFMLHRDDFNVR
jgi:ammonium transporter, Amt family